MEEFVNAVESQVIRLSRLDIALALCNIPLVFIYGNDDGAKDFMPAVLLESAFYKALQQFPFFAGYVHHRGGGHARIVVDKDNLNMPIYKESTSDVHYSELKAANFSWDRWPKELVLNKSVINVRSMSQLKLLTVHIVRLEDNSGIALFLNMSHYCVDGFGYYAFLNRWAELCKEMRREQALGPAGSMEFCFDRKVIEQAVLKERMPLDAATGRLYTHFSLVAKGLAKIPQLSLIKLVNKMGIFVGLESHVFHIPQASLDKLRDSVAEYAPDGVRISKNDVLTAVLSKLIYQCSAQPRKRNGFLELLTSAHACLAKRLRRDKQTELDEPHQVVAMLCDMRHRIGIEHKNYVGNGMISCYVANQVSLLETPVADKSVADVAMNVRRLVDRLDSGYFGTFMDTIYTSSSFTTQYFSYARHRPTAYFSDHTRFRMYDADFGNGRQEWVSMIPSIGDNTIIVSKSQPHDDGVNVFVSAKTRTMRSLLQSEYWQNLAVLLY